VESRKLEVRFDERDQNYHIGWVIPGLGYMSLAHEISDEADARRLVAAYNATRHVPVETLETDPLTLDGVEDTFNRLKAQNAQLSELKEAIYDALAEWNFTSNSFEFVRDVKSALAKEDIAAETATEKTKTP
jgi:hypothetical protein